jgi:hypothetical protein
MHHKKTAGPLKRGVKSIEKPMLKERYSLDCGFIWSGVMS